MPCTTGKHTQMTIEISKGMKDASASNVSHVSKKPLQYIHVTTLYATFYSGHVVEVTFRNHCNAYDLFSNTTEFFSVFSIVAKIMFYSYTIKHSEQFEEQFFKDKLSIIISTQQSNQWTNLSDFGDHFCVRITSAAKHAFFRLSNCYICNLSFAMSTQYALPKKKFT